MDSTIEVLAIDDEPTILELVKSAFEEEENYAIRTASNGQLGLDKLESHPETDVILLDLNMPVMNGLEFLKKVRKNPLFHSIPILVITAESQEKYQALNLGATDFLSKPLDIVELRLRVRNTARLKEYSDYLEEVNTLLEEKVKERTQKLREALKLAKETEKEIAFRLGRACEYRDVETGNHIKRVSHYCRLLAELLELSESKVELIYHASPLHDIGKVGIPDYVLLKPGPLDQDERKIMEAHALMGAEILEDAGDYPVIETARIIALTHHERFDGQGYPRKITGEKIPLPGRICALADVFDALTSERIYKDAFPLEKSLGIIKEERGEHFDPQIVDLFLDNLDEFLAIRDEFDEE